MKLKNVSKLAFAVLALSTVMTSCKKLDSLIKVNIPLQTAQFTFTIHATDNAGESTDSSVIHFNVDSLINASNASYGVANIKSAQIDSVVVTVANTTFAGLTNTSVSFYSDANTTKKTIASNAAGSTTSSLTLIPTSTIDLTDYLKATTFTYFFTSTHGVTYYPVDVTAVAYFNVVVSPN